MTKFNELSLPTVILIASIVLGGFYYASQINKQGSIEKQQQLKIEQEQRAQTAEQEAKEQIKQELDTCMAGAEESYSNQWHRECKRLGKLTSKCIDIQELDYNEYLEKYNLTDDEYKNQRGITDDNRFAGLLDYLKRRSNECSCALPISLADSVNESLQENKDACFRKHPQI